VSGSSVYGLLDYGDMIADTTRVSAYARALEARITPSSVVLDIGTQLRLAIPDDAPLHAGEVWDYAKAVDYIEKVGLLPSDVAESEVKRYLGWYGQAISYKVGEREILDIRDQAMAREGEAFDRKDFHRRMLEAGAIRLDHLREAMA